MTGVEFVADELGGLRLQPRADGCVALWLRAHHAELSYSGFPTAELRWPGNDWDFGTWDENAGLAVIVAAPLHAQCRAIHDAIMTRWRASSVSVDQLTGMRLPLIPAYFGPGGAARPLATLGALLKVLRRRSELRARLDDPERMYWLAIELSDGLLGPPDPRSGDVTHDSTDVIVAMHEAGFVHEFGRPLAGERLPYVEDVVAKTQWALELTPHRYEPDPIDDDRVAEIAQETFFDIEPWPFRALLADDPETGR